MVFGDAVRGPSPYRVIGIGALREYSGAQDMPQ